jgi:hypothetical protein
MTMANYADLWLVHPQVASQLKGAKLELRELKDLDLFWRLLSLTLKILSTNLLILLSIVFYPLVRDVWFSQG